LSAAPGGGGIEEARDGRTQVVRHPRDVQARHLKRAPSAGQRAFCFSAPSRFGCLHDVSCTLASREERVDWERYYKLHGDGQCLIHDWLGRGLGDECKDWYEAFIYLWIGFNAWAACVTSKDQDREMVDALALDQDLNERFAALLYDGGRLREAAIAFRELWPIFRVQKLRGLNVAYLRPAQSRAEAVQTYLDAGATDYRPRCWLTHTSSADGVPLDWAHTVNAIYGVRCNLFHGEKARTSEDDQRIVAAARDVLAAFIEEGELA
jgi:hypothetical protein